MEKPIRKLPFSFHATGKGVSDPQVTHDELVAELADVNKRDLVMFVRAYVQERTPAAFASNPMLWEAVREWFAARLSAHPRQIGLSGSAQTGFSLKPSKRGIPFDPTSSDLDFFVVNEDYFSVVESEIRLFIARCAASSSFLDQTATVQRQLRMGYVDLNQVPANHDQYPNLSRARNDVSIIIDRLKLHGFALKPSHLRVYQNWEALGRWVSRSFSI